MMFAKWFGKNEFRCKCGGQFCDGFPNAGMPNTFGVDTKLLQVLDEARDRIGKPLWINSGFRCVIWNRMNSGAPQSYHMKGIAADISSFDAAVSVNFIAQEVRAAMAKFGYKGAVVPYGPGKGNFVHVDMRGWDANWE